MALTSKKLDEYVYQGGIWCPYCGGADLEPGSADYGRDVIMVPVTCPHCGKQWTENYRLSDITE